ncbi:tyrosine-type recombinase/integrase [Sporosarcina sp. ACRSM]|nr:tyrosine-type recombinase/integrase [Sporosarcina sp. ACRSM]
MITSCRVNRYPFVPSNILKRMNRLMEKTSIKKKATSHIFRHTHISMLTEAGMDIATIMESVGHEDIETTMKVYTHVTIKMKKDASVKINNLYGHIPENITRSHFLCKCYVSVIFWCFRQVVVGKALINRASA